MLATKTYTLKSGAQVKQPISKAILPTCIALVIFGLSAWMVLQSHGTLRLYEFGTIIRQLFTPAHIEYDGIVIVDQTWASYFSYIFSSEVLNAFLDTLRIGFVGSVVGSVLCLPFAILCSQNIVKTKWIYVPVRFIINLVRTMPTMALAVVAVTILGLGSLAGIIATSIFTFGIMTKMIYECVEALDMGPFEALQSCGANKTQAFFYAIFPQLLPTYVGYFVYNFEINVRTSVVLGYVGAGGLGVIIQNYISSAATRSKVGAVLILTFVVVIVLQAFTRWVRGKLQ